MAKYHFKVHTADETYAGTDSNISVKLYGVEGETESQRLNGNISGNAFETDDTDEFDVEYNKDVGDIEKIDLWTDDSYGGSDWKLDYIEINRPGGNVSHFSFNEWIDDEDKTYSKNRSKV